MRAYTTTMTWLPSLFFAKGMPRAVVFVISLVMFRQMRLGTAEILFYVSCFYLPWVLKMWWAPFVDRWMNYRQGILLTQFLMMLTFGVLAQLMDWQWMVIVGMQLIAWLSAIHNVAVDRYSGSYPQAPRHTVVRELSRKISVAIGQGVLVMLVGNLQVFFRFDMLYSWRVMFYIVSGVFLLLFLWHCFILEDETIEAGHEPSYLQGQTQLATLVFFLFFYAFSQGMVGKANILFLIDSVKNGGLGLSPQEFGLVMGTMGIAGLTLGGLMGVRAIRRFGLFRCLWYMAALMLVPGVVYMMLASWPSQDIVIVGACVMAEQMAYGFGFSAYLSVLRWMAGPEWGKSLMALSMMTSCLVTGFLLETVGYQSFFSITMALGLLTILSVMLIREIPMSK